MRLKNIALFLSIACLSRVAPGQPSRGEAEYYVGAYARHYGVPVDFARAIVEQESGWKSCAVSSKGAVGLMQLMPETARRLGVRDRSNVKENVSGGVRYLAWLMWRFDGDLRLVAAAYYRGEHTIGKRGLSYSNRDVVDYVASVRRRFAQQQFRSGNREASSRRKR
jgi:soluble lytic murein transglycosylase-like protein